MFTSDTARINRDKLMGLKVMAAHDAIPSEMNGRETQRIDCRALTGLIEQSQGVALGTPIGGLPALPDDAEIEVVEPRDPVEAAPVEEVTREPSLPVLRPSRLRDVMIGGALSLLVMAAWFCATQL